MNKYIRVMAAILAASAMQAFAQEYPTKPVRAIITFTPGSSTDIVGRLVMQRVSDYWGQPVLVENRGGAGGSIATGIVAKAPADGYTLLIDSSAHSVNPSMYSNLGYDTLKDFVDIAGLAAQPNVLVVPPTATVKSVAELIATAKAKPGSINFASAGVGSGTHFNLEKFLLATGIKVTHIPYKGTQEVLTDLLGGRVDYYFTPISAGLSAIRGGKLRPIAVTTAKRNSALPDVPTVAETGVPGFEFTLWFGIWGPAGMPANVVEKINRDVNRALGEPGIREQLAKLGNDTLVMSPAEFAQFVRREVDEYAKITKAAGIKPQ
jgi:tripartite-type tricarboxylate transporter receptor subunit TctC